MPETVWTSPRGYYKVYTFVPEGYREDETDEEWAERMGFDLSVLQRREDEETPEEKAERVARASAEVAEWFEEIGFQPSEEDIAELDALLEHVGWKTPNGEAVSG